MKGMTMILRFQSNHFWKARSHMIVLVGPHHIQSRSKSPMRVPRTVFTLEALNIFFDRVRNVDGYKYGFAAPDKLVESNGNNMALANKVSKTISLQNTSFHCAPAVSTILFAVHGLVMRSVARIRVAKQYQRKRE
jgi:hypothetical protein